jgi:hypothetical protein
MQELCTGENGIMPLISIAVPEQDYLPVTRHSQKEPGGRCNIPSGSLLWEGEYRVVTVNNHGFR